MNTGDVEKVTGHVIGDPNMVVRGQEKKVSIDCCHA